MTKWREIGPGAVAAAAFIGPGTVTTATVAGAQFGYALVWALLFATFAAIVLQEMAARLGIVSRRGLGEAIMDAAGGGWRRWLARGLIIAALGIGNAAYEGGNIAGAALGARAAFPDLAAPAVALAIAGIAGAALFSGRYDIIERLLLIAVSIMTVAFAAAMIVVRPDLAAFARGALIPTIPAGGLLLALGLIGTTIVPYNLFLHAAAARKKWPSSDHLPAAKFDARFSISVGGLVSIMILATAAAALFGEDGGIANAGDMARALEPAFGPMAKYLIAAGLFAAGLSSAITAPLATGFVIAEVFGVRSDLSSATFRGTVLAILAIGALVASTGARPVEIILFAQVANGLLLPLVAIFLLIAVNRRATLGAFVNSQANNFVAGAIVLVTIFLGVRSILRAAGLW